MKRTILIILSLIGILAGYLGTLPGAVAHEAQPVEVLSARTANSKLYSLGGNKYALDTTIGVVHYKDTQGNWQNINNVFTNDQMLQAGYNLSILQKTFNQGQILDYSTGGESVKFQPMNLQYTNDLSQIQQISSPQTVAGAITNVNQSLLNRTDYQSGRIDWPNAYGTGRSFSWISETSRLKKILTITSFANLPAPQSYIIAGGNVVIEQQFIFAPSTGLSIYVDGQLWDKNSKKITANNIVFQKNGSTLFEFVAPTYYDSTLKNQGTGKLVLNKSGQNLYVSVQVPYTWLQTATYPVYIDPTVAIDVGASADDARQNYATVTLTDTVIYCSTWDRTIQLYRNVTVPQGATIDVVYESFYLVGGNYNLNLPMYFEDVDSAATPVAVNNNISGRTRTTATNTWAGILAGGWQNSVSRVTEVQEVVDREGWASGNNMASICNSYGGTTDTAWRSWDFDTSLAPKLHIEYTAGAGVSAPTVVTGNATSIEETTMTFQGNIIATGGENATSRGFYYTANTSEVGNYGTGNFTYNASSLTPGELYSITAYAINSGGIGYGANVTALTKPNPASNFTVADNGTTWLYWTWTNGTGADYVELRYQSGTTAPADNVSGTLGYWGPGTSVNVTGLTASTNYTARIFTHANSGTLWSMSDNNPTAQGTTDAEPPGATAPTVVTTNATAIGTVTATFNGNLTSLGGANVTARRFQWGTTTGNYTTSWTGYGDYSIGTFNYAETGLTPNTTYYYVASANNSAGWGTGAEVSLTTGASPSVATDNASSISYTSATFNGIISGLTTVNATTVLFEWGTSPGTYTSNWTNSVNYGNQTFNYPKTGLSDNTIYFCRAGVKTTDGDYQYGAEVAFATLTIVTPTVTSQNATSVTDTTATLNGNITITGGENADIRGFDLGLASGNYTTNLTVAGSFGTSAFNLPATGLFANTTYYFRALAHNSKGWGYGSELSFTTTVGPTDIYPPDSFTLLDLGAISLQFTVDMGTNAVYTMIRGSRTAYPETVDEGELIYYGDELSTNISGFFLPAQAYFYSAWGFDSDNITHSDNYTTATIGGEDLEALGTSLESISTAFAAGIASIVSLVIVLIFEVLALWKRLWGLYALSGFAWMFYAFSYITIDGTTATLLFLFSIYNFAMAKGAKAA